MGQYWKILNIDKEETTGHLGKLGEFFWCSSPIVNLLMAPVVPMWYKSNVPISKETLQKLQNKSGPVRRNLLSLPVELLLAIAEELLREYVDVICLSLTCVTMWEATEQVRYRSLCFKLRKASWDGDRIILLGDYAETLPEGVLTDEDKQRLGVDADDHDFGNYLYRAAQKFRALPRNLVVSPLYAKRFQSKASRLELKKFTSDKRFAHWIELDPEDFNLTQSEGDSWMVRNITKQEFVIKSNSRDLTQVLYCLIGCSDDPSVSMSGGSSLIDGRWAGDRIDITLASVHKQEHGDESLWENITAGVKRMLEMLAREEGEDFEF